MPCPPPTTFWGCLWVRKREWGFSPWHPRRASHCLAIFPVLPIALLSVLPSVRDHSFRVWLLCPKASLTSSLPSFLRTYYNRLHIPDNTNFFPLCKSSALLLLLRSWQEGVSKVGGGHTAEGSSLWDSSLNPHQEAKHPFLWNLSLLKGDRPQHIHCGLCLSPHGSQASTCTSQPELMAAWSSGLTPPSPVMKTKAM